MEQPLENKLPNIDPLQLYLGEPYVITDKIIIKQPTIGQIIRTGEQKIYSAVHVFVANTTMYRLLLWTIGVDWNKITDFDLFQMLVPSLKQEDTAFLFGDLDFSKLQRYQKQLDDKTTVVLYDPENDIEIDENTYNQIANYVRNMFNIFPKVEKAKGKTTKEWMIQEDRENAELHKNEGYKSVLLPLISSCLNHPGFKYSKSELINVGIVEFMDSVKRLQVYESSTALLKGMYSGFIDGSKIKDESVNFMRDLNASI